MKKAKILKMAYKAGAVFRWHPDFYCLLKRGFDHIIRGSFTQWKKIIQSTSPELLREPSESESKGDILFISPRWWLIHQGWETIIAYILRWQGFRPHFLICNNAMEMCDSYDPKQKIGDICAQCRRDIHGFMTNSKIPFSKFSDWIDIESVKNEALKCSNLWDPNTEFNKFTYDNFPIGDLIWISLVRHFRKIRFSSDPHAIATSRKFLESGIIAYRAIQNIINSRNWKYVFGVNGSFFIEAIAGEFARQKGIEFFSYERGIKKDYVLLSKKSPISSWDILNIYKNREPLNAAEEKEIDDYCAVRKIGGQSIVNYWPQVEADKKKIIDELKLDPTKKIFTAFPNITWDSAVINREIFFKDLWDWINTTIAHISQRPDVQLIVRVHPAEIRLRQKTTERVADLIKEYYLQLPSNIRVIDSESPISSYTLVEISDKILVYTTTVGLEAAMVGKEVIVSARTHYRGLGFTTDCANKEEYLRALDEQRAIDRPAIIEKARRYAYTLFFDTHIPFKSITEEEGDYHYNIKSLDDLKNGDFPEVGFFSKFPFNAPDGFISYRMTQLSK